MSVLNPDMTLAELVDHFGISLEDLEEWLVGELDTEHKEIVDTYGFNSIEGGGESTPHKKPHLSLVSSYLVGKYKF